MAGVRTDDRGYIVADEQLRTSVPGVYAIGDVNGGPHFTYVCLDDYRIVLDQLIGTGARSTADRVAVPSTTFLTPPLARVGVNETQARADQVLGATMFCVDAQEVINLIALAMRTGTTATQLRDGSWIHPSSTEALNEVLAELQPLS